MCGGGGGGDGGAAAAKRAEAARRAKIAQGTQSIDSAFAGFTPEYYGGIEKAYTDYAQPELERQYQDALRALTFALARKGLSSSTAAGTEQQRMEQQFGKYRTDILSAGKSYSDRARSDVESSRGNLVNQLVATEDPVSAGQSALRFAQAKTAPPSFDPIGKFVFDISEGLRGETVKNDGRPLFQPLVFGSNPGSSISYSREE